MIPLLEKRFRNNIDVIEKNGGTFGIDKGVVDITLYGCYPPITMAETKYQQTSKSQEITREESLACAFILWPSKTRFRNLVENLDNAYTQG